MLKFLRLISSALSNLSPKFTGIAQRPYLALTLIGGLAFAGSATIGMIGGIAKPGEHDEFSYLLAADTFAHGRLTNPTHPMWIHFESIHIIHLPTYMSKYPPAQGAILALGKLLTGYPIVGVWLSMGLMCAAICWMLQAWVPKRWALIGGFFAVLHPIMGIGGAWAQSYWGGALAATGGALVLGGVRYLIKEPRVHQALLTGLGITILANSRPYEGLLLSVCAASLLSWGFLRKREIMLALVVRKVILPLIFTCCVSAVWIGYYNFRVTRNPFRLPYQIHEQTYGIAPLFIWQNPAPMPEYRHASIREFHQLYTLFFYHEKHSLIGFIKVSLKNSLMYFILSFSVFAIPLLFSIRALIRWTLQSSWARIALATHIFVTAGIMLETYALLHYWAPVLALNYYVIVQSIRLWRRRDRRVRPLIVPALFCLAAIFMARSAHEKIQEENRPFSMRIQRANLIRQLEQQSVKHVVLVRHTSETHDDDAWVYNQADIDEAKIVWAHDMDPQENCKLVNYFKDRVVWSLDIERDGVPVKLNPFPRDSCQ